MRYPTDSDLRMEFEFRSQFEDKIVSFKTKCVTIDEVFETFENFLKASGFAIKGHIEIVEDENA